MICQVGPVIGEFEGLKVEVSFHPWWPFYFLEIGEDTLCGQGINQGLMKEKLSCGHLLVQNKV